MGRAATYVAVLLFVLTFSACKLEREAKNTPSPDTASTSGTTKDEILKMDNEIGSTTATGEWTTDYQKALADAAKLNKFVLLDFTGSDWCGWCMKLDDEVFSKVEFIKFAKENFILVKLDFPQRKPQSDELKKQNEALMNKYGVRGFPTIIILDKSGKQIGQTGYQEGGAVNYVEHLKGIIK